MRPIGSVRTTHTVGVLALASAVLFMPAAAWEQDPLPSWNDGAAKQAIVHFVAQVTAQGPGFVPLSERVAVFDNDGTLWVEQPIYTQFVFALDRVKAMAPQHPEWKQQPALQAVLSGDMKTFAATGEKGLMEVMMVTHAGMTADEFQKTVKAWLATARHPRFHRPYTECVYQPMLEVLAYLRANAFKTYVVSGGGVEFMRPFTDKAYGIPPEQVIGSSIQTRFQLRNGIPVLLRLPEVNFVDDKEGKPVAINRIIGRRPIAAFGNSDGDLQMLEWTAAGPGPRLTLLVHHTDAQREYEYDRKSQIGTLDKALDEAKARHWILASMKQDWKTIFPPEAGGR